MLVIVLFPMCFCRGRFSVVRRCVDQQSGADVAAKFISRSLISVNAIMTEVNILRNARHAGLVLPKCVYETDTACIIIMPL